MGIGRGYGHGYGRGYGRGTGYGKGSGFSGFTCVKFFFFTFNVIFWLLGCAILGVGIWLHVSKGAYASIAPSLNFLSATALCIAAGTIVLIVGFLGCCGAIMENQCMLLTYFIIVVLIFIMEIVAGILAFVYRDEIERTVKGELILGIQTRYGKDSNEEGLTKMWDHIQSTYHCCGVEGYKDWFDSDYNTGQEKVPPSCCVGGGHCDTENPKEWYTQNCLTELKYQFKQNLYIIGVVGISVGVIQVLGMVAAMALFCCLRNEKNYE